MSENEQYPVDEPSPEELAALEQEEEKEPTMEEEEQATTEELQSLVEWYEQWKLSRRPYP